MCENILRRVWHGGDRIPSIRELAMDVQVNPNTVTRTYAYLQDQGIIFNRRGIGYFVADRAYHEARELKRRSFIDRDPAATVQGHGSARPGAERSGTTLPRPKPLIGAHRRRSHLMYTNRILASSGVVLILLTAGVAVAIRVFSAPAGEDGDGLEFDRQIEGDRQIDVERFTAIELSGGWELHLTHAAEYSAVLIGDQDLVDTAEVSTDGDRLSVIFRDVDEDRTARIMITAPAIETLSLAGVVNGTVVGLDATELTVRLDGASNLVFEDSTIGDLTLQTAGAANVDLGRVAGRERRARPGGRQPAPDHHGRRIADRTSFEGVGNVRYSGETRQRERRHRRDREGSPQVAVGAGQGSWGT